MTEAIEMPCAAEHAGDFGHHARPIFDVEPQVVAARRRRRNRAARRAASRFDQSSSVRNVIAVRPTTVSIMSATTAEAVGICPAPSP